MGGGGILKIKESSCYININSSSKMYMIAVQVVGGGNR